VKKRSGLYPRVGVDAAGSGVVSQAGGVTLVETLRVSGLDAALSRALAPWRKPTATHDPAKVVCDLALTLAVGGDCLADVAVVRAEPGVYGRVAWDPTLSRTVDVLAGDAPRALARSISWRSSRLTFSAISPTNPRPTAPRRREERPDRPNSASNAWSRQSLLGNQ